MTQATARKTSRLGFGSPRLNDYFGEWAISADHAAGLIAMADRVNLRIHVAKVEGVRQAEDEELSRDMAQGTGSRFGDGYGETLLEDGTGVIRLSGTMMKFVSSLSSGTSTVAVRRMVRKAQADPGVARVLLMVDSPGGTVAGTQDLADDVAALAADKPCIAYVEDLCCSAAMWVASQCNQISAGRASLVGSIGALMAVADFSKAAAKEGIKVHVITSTGAEKFKGAGVMGAKITDEQLAEWKARLDDLNAHFLDAIGKGRKMDANSVKAIADGRVHIAAEARKAHLIDNVESADMALARLRAMPTKATPAVGARAEEQAGADSKDEPDNQAGEAGPTEHPAGGTSAGASELSAAPAAESVPMDPKTTAAGATAEPKPATVAELKGAFPRASSDFIVEQAEKGATLAVAKDAYIAWQDTQIRSRDEDLAKAQKEAAAATAATATATATVAAPAATARKPGVPPIETSQSEQKSAASDGTAYARFARLVDAKIKAGKGRDVAVSQVSREEPALHQQMIDEETEAYNRRRPK
jgi:signal peptide peptidase SppA